jgi:hypothetical protein
VALVWASLAMFGQVLVNEVGNEGRPVVCPEYTMCLGGKAFSRSIMRMIASWSELAAVQEAQRLKRPR